MKSVLISTKPKWCEKICHEIGKDETGKPIYEKRIEARKSAPKEVPFKAYIYETKGATETPWADEDGHLIFKGRGQVIGEFVCDKVDEYKFHEGLTKFNSMGLTSRTYSSYFIFADDYKSMCLSYDEVKNYGKGKTLYGWHISDLKIYDKPKELSEFYAPCPIKNKDCENCIRYGKPHKWDFDEKQGLIYCTRRLTRPPQSWQYVEEVKV